MLYQQFIEFFNNGYSHIPIIIEKSISSFDSAFLLEKIKKNNKNTFIFESSKIGRFTYVGSDPLYTIKGKNNKTIVSSRNGEEREVEGNPLFVLKSLMKDFSVPNIKSLLKFYGGAIGYLSYDMAKYFERLPDKAIDDLQFPDLYFMVIDKLWVYDNKEKKIYYIEYLEAKGLTDIESKYKAKYQQMEQALEDIITAHDALPANINITKHKVDRSLIVPSLTKDQFVQAVNRVKEYITEGDVFQVNLSVRQSRQLEAKGIDIYKHLRLINPSPYMGYIDFGDLELVSGSPELLIEVNNRIIQTRPIAGTRPRGRNEEEDLALTNELLNNEKEVAEHIMLVDLERNDLGRVCKYGTVKVTELMVVEKYSHVMHIVSNVVGEINDNNDIYDCIKATFPGGTITGAPKIRTMEIIEELEPYKRGPYTGSMGWIGFNNSMELNILIRTLAIKNGKGYIQAGAGIVIDSIPENEYIESLNKAEALWVAVESSERERKGD